MDDRIEVRNGQRCRVEVMRRDNAGNVVSEFVQPLDDEPGMVLHNVPNDNGKDERFIDNEADVPVLDAPGGQYQNIGSDSVPVLDVPTVNVKPKNSKATTITNDDDADDDVPVLQTPQHKEGGK